MASSSEPLHDLSTEPSIGEVQSPPAATLRDSEVRTVPAEKEVPVVTVDQVTKHVGDEVRIKFAVASLEVGKTKQGKPFIKLDLVDKTGRIEGRVWDAATVPFEAGDVIGVEARADEFNGQPQVIIQKIWPLPDADPSDYLPASHISRDALEKTLDDILASLRGDAGSIVRLILSDPELRDLFLEAPAAIKNHHAYARGLAEHTLSMVQAARGLVSHYQFYYLDPIDAELVVAGILLHDLGKVIEYERNGLSWETSLEGELVGHIPMVDAMIVDAGLATCADPDIVLRLRHIVLSHHGRKEWGSPVEPRTMEAQIVHQVDMLDSRLGMMREAVKGLERGERSERVWALGGRVVR